MIADPFEQNAEGEFAGLALIPEVLSVAPSAFLPHVSPKRARNDFSPSPEDVLQLFRRAWVPDDDDVPGRRIH